MQKLGCHFWKIIKWHNVIQSYSNENQLSAPNKATPHHGVKCDMMTMTMTIGMDARIAPR